MSSPTSSPPIPPPSTYFQLVKQVARTNLAEVARQKAVIEGRLKVLESNRSDMLTYMQTLEIILESMRVAEDRYARRTGQTGEHLFAPDCTCYAHLRLGNEYVLREVEYQISQCLELLEKARVDKKRWEDEIYHINCQYLLHIVNQLNRGSV